MGTAAGAVRVRVGTARAVGLVTCTGIAGSNARLSRVTTELLPSSRCRQHHLLPKLTTDFLALLPQKARERASMSDARSDGFGQRCFHGRQVGRRLVRAHRHQSPSVSAWRDELNSVLLRCSGFIYALMRSACAGNAWNHHSRCWLLVFVVGFSDRLDIKHMTLLNATEPLAGRQKKHHVHFT